MGYRNLQHFIEELDTSGELIRIKEFADPELEIAEITDRISKLPEGGKALLFENTGTQFPVLINSMGSNRRICMALGISELEETSEKITSLFNKLAVEKTNFWQKLKMLPMLKEVSSLMPTKIRGRGECQEIVMEKPDLSKLPILKCWPLDGGRFVTLPLVHTVDPETGFRNTGMYRLQVFSRDTTGMHWHRHKTGAKHFELYKKLGKKMPIAVSLGGDPAYTYAATAPLPENIDEYMFAGFLRRKKVELVKCLSQDIYVPADSDFVLEGYVDPNEEFRLEGPFGDHTGFYSLEDYYPVFHITCITHRRDAVYPATIVGVPPQEDAWIAKATERIFLSPIRMAIVPEILDMNLPVEGVAHNLAIIKIKKTYPGQAFKVMNALWGAGQMMFNKAMIVTSDETDIFSPFSVLDAIFKNVTEPDHICFQKGPADVLDHSAEKFTFGGKICFDATEKLSEEKSDIGVSSSSQDIRKNLEKLIPNSKINYSLLEKNYGVVIIPIEKTSEGVIKTIIKNIESIEIAGLRYIICVDKDMCTDDLSFITWLVLANIDPNRDCYMIRKNKDFCLLIDATRKTADDGFERPWPEIIKSDKKTIESIDKKWPSLGLGIFIDSPSKNK